MRKRNEREGGEERERLLEREEMWAGKTKRVIAG